MQESEDDKFKKWCLDHPKTKKAKAFFLKTALDMMSPESRSIAEKNIAMGEWLKATQKVDTIQKEIDHLLERYGTLTLANKVLGAINEWSYQIRLDQDKVNEYFVKQYSSKLKAFKELADILNTVG